MKVTRGKLDPSVKLFGGSGSGIMIPLPRASSPPPEQPAKKGLPPEVLAELHRTIRYEMREQMGQTPEGNELPDILRRRLNAEGYTFVRQFRELAKVPVPLDTMWRMFSHDDYGTVDAAEVAVVCRYLNFTEAEISELLPGQAGA